MSDTREPAAVTVLVALDESEVSVRAAEAAVRLFSPLPDVTFLVVNVSPILVPWVGTIPFGAAAPMLFDPTWARPPQPPDGDDERRLLGEARSLGMPDATAEVRQGDAVEQICSVADDHDVDVIVVGSHDRSGLRRLFDPSVADGVVHGSPRPVLVVSGT